VQWWWELWERCVSGDRIFEICFSPWITHSESSKNALWTSVLSHKAPQWKTDNWFSYVSLLCVRAQDFEESKTWWKTIEVLKSIFFSREYTVCVCLLKPLCDLCAVTRSSQRKVENRFSHRSVNFWVRIAWTILTFEKCVMCVHVTPWPSQYWKNQKKISPLREKLRKFTKFEKIFKNCTSGLRRLLLIASFLEKLFFYISWKIEKINFFLRKSIFFWKVRMSKLSQSTAMSVVTRAAWSELWHSQWQPWLSPLTVVTLITVTRLSSVIPPVSALRPLASVAIATITVVCVTVVAAVTAALPPLSPRCCHH
jgi:hypothetical protein